MGSVPGLGVVLFSGTRGPVEPAEGGGDERRHHGTLKSFLLALVPRHWIPVVAHSQAGRKERTGQCTGIYIGERWAKVDSR